MDFSSEQCMSPTEIHKNIYTRAINRTPIEVSLQDDTIDNTLRESCKAYFDFTNDMFSDMYENLLEYGLKAGELEEYLNGKKLTVMKRINPNKTAKIQSDTYNGVKDFLLFLYRISAVEAISEDKIILSQAQYEGILRKTEHINIFALERIGLRTNIRNDEVVITSEKHPNMFMAMSKLRKASERAKNFNEHNFFVLEYRQIFGDYTPKYSDVFQPLNKENKHFAYFLHEYLTKKKCSTLCNTFWKVNYKYKGKHVFVTITEGNSVEFRINTGITKENIASLNNFLERQSEEVQKLALRKFRYCQVCPCCAPGMGDFVEILNKKKRLCKVITFYFKNPKENEIETVKKLIDFRIENIHNAGKK